MHTHTSFNKRTIIPLVLSLGVFLDMSAEKETIFVARVTVINAAYCPSRYALHFSDADVCVSKKGNLKVSSLVNTQVKLGYRLNGSLKHNGKSEDQFEIVSIDPSQEAGTSYEREVPRSFWANTAEVLNATAQEYNRQHGYNTPDVYQPASPGSPTKTPSGGVSATSATLPNNATEKVVPSLNECVAQSSGLKGEIVFHNSCAQQIDLLWIGQSGRGSITLAPGASGSGSLSNQSGAARGQFTFYACPHTALFEDINGNFLKTEERQFRCVLP